MPPIKDRIKGAVGFSTNVFTKRCSSFNLI
jgi:hypothetical protein